MNINYYLNPAINNSALSYIDPTTGGCPAKFYDYINGKLEGEKSPSLERGDYIHKFILTPEEFSVLVINKMPSEAVQEMVKEIFAKAAYMKSAEEQAALILGECTNFINEALAAKDWYSNRTIESRTATLLKEGEEYFNALKVMGDRTVLNSDLYETIKRCAESIQMNDAAKLLLVDSPGQEAFNELEIYWTEEWGGMQLSFKAKIDRLVVDHKEKTFSIIDFKTTSKNIHNFPESVDYYRYYRQISFYEHAVKDWLEKQGYLNYQADDHYIVAVETKGYYQCRVYIISEPYLRKGRKETADLLNRIVFHFSTQDWIRPKEDQETVNKTYTLVPTEYV